jgi:hypothetical protein
VLRPEIEYRDEVTFSNLQFSNFKAPVIPSSLVAILLVLEGSIITGLQINLYLEQPMKIQLFATFFQRRK